MKTVFVTGVNGLLGTNLVHALLAKGYKVKGLVRDVKKFKGHRHQNLQLIEGNLSGDFTDTIKGAEIIIHIAAETRQSLPDYHSYKKINYDATIHLFNTAIKCRAGQFIFVSTANTIGYDTIDNPGTEENPMWPPFTASFYAKSKMEAENYLLQYADQIKLTIINPGFMIGAFDSKPGSGKIILHGWRKRIVFYPPGGKSFVHVQDVASAIMNSFGQTKSGEKYLLVNENLSYLQFFKKLHQYTGETPMLIPISPFVLLMMGYFGDVLRWFKIKTSISSVNMKILCVKNFYSHQKSITALGVVYKPVATAIKDAVDYFSAKYAVE